MPPTTICPFDCRAIACGSFSVLPPKVKLVELKEVSKTPARTAYYPMVDLLASGGLESGAITTLFQGPSAFWAVGGQVLYTIFDAGRPARDVRCLTVTSKYRHRRVQKVWAALDSVHTALEEEVQTEMVEVLHDSAKNCGNHV